MDTTCSDLRSSPALTNRVTLQGTGTNRFQSAKVSDKCFLTLMSRCWYQTLISCLKRVNTIQLCIYFQNKVKIIQVCQFQSITMFIRTSLKQFFQLSYDLKAFLYIGSIEFLHEEKAPLTCLYRHRHNTDIYLFICFLLISFQYGHVLL